MRVKSLPGFRPLLLLAAAVLLLNAQCAWWVLDSLRENRMVLDLERELLDATLAETVARLESRLNMETRRFAKIPPGVLPAAEDPFPEIEVMEGAQESGWVVAEGRVAFAMPLSRRRHVLAWLDEQAPRRWLGETAPDLVLLDRDDPVRGLPRKTLAFPLDRWAIGADRSVWQESVSRYRRRVVTVALNGTLFLSVMMLAVGLLWKVYRRESAVAVQHQNFVSAVTHELKTPMAGIRVALETVLAERADEAGRRRFLANALDDVDRLAGLVDKVLEVTQYAQGAHRLRIELGDLSALVEEETAAVARRAAPTGVRIETLLEPGVQAPFDPEAFTIVLSNLLENAIKYGSGSALPVVVRLFLKKGQAVVEVSDGGHGISSVELKRVFEPFFRSADQAVRRIPGTGVGLYVAREIVVAHGGKLLAESRGRGKGAAFRIVLPGAGRLSEEDESE